MSATHDTLRNQLGFALRDKRVETGNGILTPAQILDVVSAVVSERNAAQARHLAQISLQVRDRDVQLVQLTEEGVAPTGISLADELYLIAYQLDADTATKVSRDGGRFE